jgi:hypothetical protein
VGDYTATQGFYKPNPVGELVDVEQHLNFNLRRIDERVKPLLEYQITNETSITSSSLPKDTGFKWYKPYSNSLWTWRADGLIQQDVNSFVDNWTDATTFLNSYTSYDTTKRLSYSVFNGFVRWRGKVKLSNDAALPTNTTTAFLTPPSATVPTKARYFTVWGGNATSDFQSFRIFIPSTGNMEFIKYGGNGATSSENYFCMDDVFYPIQDT